LPSGRRRRGSAGDGQGRARAMPADIALAITGVAGFEPDEDVNPVGLIHVAVAIRNGPIKAARDECGERGRDEICPAAMGAALALAEELLTASCRERASQCKVLRRI
jgi:nicotinamide mononucleotide (NMN) deamidase PncC